LSSEAAKEERRTTNLCVHCATSATSALKLFPP
jgi:hypothetical protein